MVDIPSQLRQILETCLARDASPRILEIYLPKVREIVINLLQGLKRKQARYRARTNDTSDNNSKIPTTTATTVTATTPQQRSFDPRDISLPGNSSVKDSPGDPDKRRQSPTRRPVGAREEPIDRKRSSRRDTDRHAVSQQVPEVYTQAASPLVGGQTPPPNEALQKLQISDALQRRASKRYSAYNFAKLDGLDAEIATRNTPPIPARRSGSRSPELVRTPSQPDSKNHARKRSPDRRVPVEPPLQEEDESILPRLESC